MESYQIEWVLRLFIGCLAFVVSMTLIWLLAHHWD